MILPFLLCCRLIDYTLADNGRQDFGFRAELILLLPWVGSERR